MKRTLDVLASVLIVLTIAWALVPSSVFIRVISMDITEEGVVRFVRETPMGAVQARWHSEIYLVDADGRECNSGDWHWANYQPVPGNVVSYEIGEWADRCLEAGPPFYIVTTRQVMLFGIIPLRPDVHRTDVQGTRQAPEHPES